MIYGYRCTPCGRPFEADFPRGEAAPHVRCTTCSGEARRDYSGVGFKTDDEFRRGYLSSSLEKNLAEQGRPLDPLAPKDKFEARRIEAATGRRYIGNDISGLRKVSQDAILADPKHAREVSS